MHKRTKNNYLVLFLIKNLTKNLKRCIILIVTATEVKHKQRIK